ncbi:uncharacterized protein F5891DRAFT_1209450 [Suillus fuscotomentosus]|uniref:NTF2 domain-containing protein n=1 Tax=Suillus fuscotomentosus TaxID=1912939 RepID=A0AAD4DSH6_9AGAM|nr:uncharacterized protein F5891DRAFT_1209450 [Suillus fuscotomentosus]KAG1892959.1 hypothetical protein F5891DRAFT_1209450 [Suillus fuscotomentosus]
MFWIPMVVLKRLKNIYINGIVNGVDVRDFVDEFTTQTKSQATVLITFVNEHPNHLHCFYTKTSTFIHGTEGEDVKACFGQQEIHNKITSLGFDDCKVYIHSVDAQFSANGGIIIQVIGEMSNHGDPWRKFMQTFFLAEQPNSYFVLNNIFRFLKEETVEDDASEPEASSTAPFEPAPESVCKSTPPPPAPEPEVEEPTIMPELAPVEVNGIHHEPEMEHTPEPSIPEAEPEPEPPALIALPQAPAPPALVTPTPAPEQAPARQAPAPAPKPAAPKTWASLAAADSKARCDRRGSRWGAQVATELKGMSEVPASAASPTPPAGGAPSPAPRREHSHSHPHSPIASANALTIPQCFVKGVTEVMSQQQLITLLARLGTVKDVEIKAIIASLPTNTGSEGRLCFDSPEGSVRIIVETRKERGDRPVSHPGGGAPNSESRGSFQGRGGPWGRGCPPPQKIEYVRGGRDIMQKSPSCSFVLLAIVFW